MRAQRHLPRLAACLLLGLTGRVHGDGPPAPATSVKLKGTWDDKLPPGAVARLGTDRLRHGLWLHSLTYSPDGKTLISAGGDDTIRFWDAATGKQLRVLTGLGSIRSFALSPTGRTLAVPLRSGNELTVRFFDLVDGAERTWNRGSAAPQDGFSEYAVGLAPDDKSVAATDDLGTVSVIDVNTGNRIELGKHDDSFVYSLTFAPGGTLLASCAGDGVRLWDLSGGKAHRTLQAPIARVCNVAFTPDGKQLIASGNALPDAPGADAETAAVWAWDVASGKKTRSLQIAQAKENVGSPTVSLDGRVLAVQAGRRLVLWDLKADQLIRSIPVGDERSPYVSGVSLSPDGKSVAFGVGSVGRIYETSSGRPVWPDPDDAHGPVSGLAFSSDGRLLAALNDTGGLRLWDAYTGRLVHRSPGSQTPRVAIVFVPGSNLLAVLYGDGGVRLWDPATGRERALSVPPRERARGSRLAASPDGRYLASGNWTDGQAGGRRFLRVWDLASGTEPQQLEIERAVLGWFSAIGFSPDGTTLTATTVNGQRYWWRLQSGRFTGGEILSYSVGFSSMAFGPDGTLAATESHDNGVRLWAAGADRIRKQLDGPKGFGRILAFSPDGRYLVSAGGLVTGGSPGDRHDHSIRVYKLTDWHEVLRWDAPISTAVCSAAFSPGGRYLVTGMTDSTLLAWDLYPVRPGKRADPGALWEELKTYDAKQAHVALSRLIALGDRAAAGAGSRLKPARSPEPGQVGRLIAALDSNSFAARQKAARELSSLFEAARPALERARDSAASPEVRNRAEALLKSHGEDKPLPPEVLGAVRAVEVLECVGTPRAKEVLRSLVLGAPDARLTREARAALGRLDAKEKK